MQDTLNTGPGSHKVGEHLADCPVTFHLSSRLLTSGDIAIVLHLYRGDERALSTTLTTCAKEESSAALWKCRAYLKNLGIQQRTQPSKGSSGT